MQRLLASVRAHPVGWTAGLTMLAYLLVIGTFLEWFPFYPQLDVDTSTRLSHMIAGANVATVTCLALGWYWIRTDRVERHRLAMIGAVVFILVFLVLYLIRVGGGGTKHFDGPTLVTYVYLLMLAVHIVLSIVAVPLVIYALALGITHTPFELHQTSHARVGRAAVAVWSLSLVLGLVTYALLEHVYGWEYIVT